MRNRAEGQHRGVNEEPVRPSGFDAAGTFLWPVGPYFAVPIPFDSRGSIVFDDDPDKGKSPGATDTEIIGMPQQIWTPSSGRRPN